MTGTLIDLTPLGPLLRGLGVLYWLVGIALIVGVLAFVKRTWLKLGTALLIGLAFAVPVVRTKAERETQVSAGVERRVASLARFEEYCRSAGIKVHHAVDGVEGVRWKWRTRRPSPAEQYYTLNDPYGHDCRDEECVGNLLRVTKGSELNPEEAARHQSGYRFVETLDARDGRWYRYEGHIVLPWTAKQIEAARHRGDTIGPSAHRFKPVGTLIDAPTARYSLIWEDLSTQEDRVQWIAASALRIVDLKTNEVLGERIGYMVDRGLGDLSSFRDPWAFATDDACPAFSPQPRSSRRHRTYRETRDFALQVVRPPSE